MSEFEISFVGFSESFVIEQDSKLSEFNRESLAFWGNGLVFAGLLPKEMPSSHYYHRSMNLVEHLNQVDHTHHLSSIPKQILDFLQSSNFRWVEIFFPSSLFKNFHVKLFLLICSYNSFNHFVNIVICNFISASNKWF